MSDNEDFMVNSSANYVFSNTTSTMACVPFTIVDDRFVEANETLSVHLSAINSFVALLPYALITIVDDDSKLTISGTRKLTYINALLFSCNSHN